jgi:hypothetical protein
VLNDSICLIVYLDFLNLMMKQWTLDREQRRNILGRFECLDRALEKAEGTIERQNRITDKLTKELKKMKSTHQMLSSSESTADASGEPPVLPMS